MVLGPLCLLLRVFVNFAHLFEGFVWSRRQPLASVGAVLSLLDGPTGCVPAFCVVWFRFRVLRRYFALWPAEVRRVYCLLEMVGLGCPGHGPIHLLSAGAAEIGFLWLCLDLVDLCLAIWLALFSTSRLLFLMLGAIRCQLIFPAGRVFGVGLCWISWFLAASLLFSCPGKR